MSAFDDLTLGEVEDIERMCLDGQPFAEANPIKLAGAVMWMVKRKDDPTLEWDDFRYKTTMNAIRDFSEQEMTNGDGESPKATS